MLAHIHRETVEKLSAVLSSDLMDELSMFTVCCEHENIPIKVEIRIAQAWSVRWMQDLLQGI